MRTVFKVLLGVIIVVAALLSFSSRKEKSFALNAPPPPSIHTYYYYPKANFYYDSSDSKYIRWDPTAASWMTTEQLPVDQGDMGKSVRIGAVSGPVWKENQHHRLIYSVSLYSAPKDFKKEEKVKDSQHAKSKTSPETDKAQKKSGVKRFLEKIFPPKKKKDSL